MSLNTASLQCIFKSIVQMASGKNKMSAGMKRAMKGYIPTQSVEKQEGMSRKRDDIVVSNNKLEQYKNILENYEDHLKKTIENCSKNTKEAMEAKRNTKMF